MVMTDVLVILVTVGTPLVLLLGVGYVMQRWHHQRETGLAPCPATGPSEAVYASAPPGRAAGRRCWQIKGCSPAERNACPAYARSYLPCWLAVELANGGRSRDECLSCARYKSGLVG